MSHYQSNTYVLQADEVIVSISEKGNDLGGSSTFGSSSGGDSKSMTESFVSTFTDIVQASDALTDVFEISQTTPTNLGNFMYDYIKASATNLGAQSPHTIADTVAKAVDVHFETLIPSAIVKVFANTAAKYLQSEGRLNPTNVASLAVSYADALTEIAKQNVKQDNPESKLKALMDGFEKFLTSVDLLVADKGQTIASAFANEVKLAGLEFRKGGNSYAIN
ncbi:hypothetical protein AVEN_103123-1 [Araneus ventricosus]|uniref:Tubuliform egg casing silk strands structural domain-containing protein n=1 Tax=Araneus ventricosus TaxID=182803 RepID=A0A4Y2STT0_ARAVE|nr:hypothetical protein AVEN_103123-1 [Araneus ventricosus]